MNINIRKMNRTRVILFLISFLIVQLPYCTPAQLCINAQQLRFRDFRIQSPLNRNLIDNQPETSSIKPYEDIPSKKSPVLAGLLSLFLPGTGQAYNGQWLKAGIQWTLIAGSIYMMIADVNFDSDSEPMPALTKAGIALGASTWIWSVIDAPISANGINKERAKRMNRSKSSYGINYINIVISF